MKNNIFKESVGEFIGTFILVFFGCGSVFVAVLFGALTGLLQVALVWGIGIAIAIYISGGLSGAHLNPAVSIAMVIAKKLHVRQLFHYIPAQFAGAIIAALVLLALFTDSITHFEHLHGIVRGSKESIRSAMIFGEFYPNPALSGKVIISTSGAFMAEFLGTSILLISILFQTDQSNESRPSSKTAPLFIGLTVSILICIIAPLTQAGFNPARDFGPRIVSAMSGWGSAAFQPYSWLVYILAPITGAVSGVFVYQAVKKLF